MYALTSRCGACSVLRRVLGSHLARIEMHVIISTLFTRFPELRLAVPDGEVPWNVGSSVWGLAELPVAF
jgi:pentalenic acid synthase